MRRSGFDLDRYVRQFEAFVDPQDGHGTPPREIETGLGVGGFAWIEISDQFQFVDVDAAQLQKLTAERFQRVLVEFVRVFPEEDEIAGRGDRGKVDC